MTSQTRVRIPWRPTLAVASLLLLTGLASAGSPEAPDITDPIGDAGPEGTAAPAGFAWGDIVAAWFEDDAQVLTVRIQVAMADAPPEDGEVAVIAEVGERGFVLGWSSFLNPTPPVPVRSGFACDLAPDGTLLAETCGGLDGASVAGDVYEVPVPRARLGSPVAGTLVQAMAYSEHFVAGAHSVRVDETAPGEAYALTSGPAPPAGETEEGPAAPAATGDARDDTGEDATSLRPTSTPEATGDADRATPGAPWAAGTLAVLGVAAAARVAGSRR